MSVRYLFNTSGNYVAFISGTNVFTPSCEWIGVITQGNQMYDTNGIFKGYILDDDRVVVNLSDPKRPKTLRPSRPMRPMRPLRPLRRLAMLPLPSPYQDVFANTSPTKSLAASSTGSGNLGDLMGARLIAADDKFLGTVNTNRFDPESMLNRFGDYGSPYQENSIFNKYGDYGSRYGSYSPWNRYATPPVFVKNGESLGRLTVDAKVKDRIDPDEFVNWLKSL
jgi:hypothetical protein